jgi:hypothetical protein
MSHKDVLEIHQELIFADGIVSLSRYLYVLYEQDLPDKKLFSSPGVLDSGKWDFCAGLPDFS